MRLWLTGLALLASCIHSTEAVLELTDGSKRNGRVVLVADDYYCFFEQGSACARLIPRREVRNCLSADGSAFDHTAWAGQRYPALAEYPVAPPNRCPAQRELTLAELQAWYGVALDLKNDAKLARAILRAEALVAGILASPAEAAKPFCEELLALKLDFAQLRAIVRHGTLLPVSRPQVGSIIASAPVPGFAGKSVCFVANIPPDYTPAKTWPVILWLHHTGPGCVDYTQRYPKQIRSQYLILAPWASGDHGWGPSSYGRQQIWTALNWLTTYYRTDCSRVYLEGFSMGGIGAKRNAIISPERLAAIASRSGPPLNRNSAALYVNLHNLPLINLVGIQDPLIPAEQTRWEKNQVEVEAKNTNAQMLLIEDGHSSFDSRDEDVYTFFSKHARHPWPAHLRFASQEDGPSLRHYYIEIQPDNRDNLPIVANILSITAVAAQRNGNNRDELMRLGQDKKNIIEQKTTWDKPREIELLVDRASNTITIGKALRLRGLKIYVDDDLIEMDKPIEVRFNGAIIARQRVQRSIPFMLSEARRLGRREITYWGAIEVALTR